MIMIYYQILRYSKENVDSFYKYADSKKEK